MDSTFFFYLSAVGYFVSFVFYLLHLIGSPSKQSGSGASIGITATSGLWVLKQTTWGKLATWATAVTVMISTTGIVLRMLELARTSELLMPLPVTNTYETLAFFSWAIPLTYLFFEWRYKLKAVGAFATGLAFIFIAIASSPLLSQEVKPLVPALQSYWLVFHVLFTLLGEAFFAVAFGAGVLFLWLRRRAHSVDTLKMLDNLGYKAIALGFPLFTLGGLVFGAIWAQHAWGRYWGWDPKETWMLITWLFYALYLHVRVKWGWRDAKTAWLAVGGFAVAMFTWLGVNYLLVGLHSYAG